MEQRANSPLFRFSAPAVVQNLVLDLCGFRECLACVGNERCTPLIEHCNIRCSGDHAVVCWGAAAPTLRVCDVSARKAGVLCLGASRPSLHECVINACEQQGVRAVDASWPRLERCRLVDNGAEGIVAMDNAGVEAIECTITGSKGPGVDVSGHAHATLSGCNVADNAGGIFLWDTATAALQTVRLAGGPHHALLADGHTRPRLRACNINGDTLLLSPEAAAGVLEAGLDNVVAVSSERATLPPELGCFKFEADRYTRKQ